MQYHYDMSDNESGTEGNLPAMPLNFSRNLSGLHQGIMRLTHSSIIHAERERLKLEEYCNNPARVDNQDNHYPDLTKYPQYDSNQTQDTNVIQLTTYPVLPQTPVHSPIVNGISLLPVKSIPDNYQSLFPFRYFNAVQSKLFNLLYNGDSNVVVSSPTGSGKTVLFELAILRLITICRPQPFKVIYVAPTKSLCAEREIDWSNKFRRLNLSCGSLTGDTKFEQIDRIKSADIIITTPEKWDSVTRRWMHHGKLVDMVKLFLVDEVHNLASDRGAALEAVVSRMRTVCSNIRFIALSATIPNAEDIAAWIGKKSGTQIIPASLEVFGEEFRPVKIKKFVYGYTVSSPGNSFMMDKILNTKLPEVLRKHYCRKPVMVFCATRNIAVSTAKSLSENSKFLPPLQTSISLDDGALEKIVKTGVAYHHAGLSLKNRNAIECAFRDGLIHVICCTSTLSVGVNLPTHLVIIKNTTFWSNGAMADYSNLEISQMIGRAGRSDTDVDAIAVIMTEKSKKAQYEKILFSTDNLESCLHTHLIEHLNAEIVLGTINDLESALMWLRSTFLYVRMRANPDHYKFTNILTLSDPDKTLEEFARDALNSLSEANFIKFDNSTKIQARDPATLMAKFYVNFATCKAFQQAENSLDIARLIALLAEAEEFGEIRIKHNEKKFFKQLSKMDGIRYPLSKGQPLENRDKINLMIQSDIGHVDIPDYDGAGKLAYIFNMEKAVVMDKAEKLIGCLVDFRLQAQDAISVKNALELSRSIKSKAWNHSVHMLRQLEGLGPVKIKKLSQHGIKNFEDFRNTDVSKLQYALGMNPVAVRKLVAQVESLPQFRISATRKSGKKLELVVEVEVRASNNQVQKFWNRMLMIADILTFTSGGALLDFRRIPVHALVNTRKFTLSQQIRREDDITCIVMLEGVVSVECSVLVAGENPSCEKSDSKRIRAVTDDFDSDFTVDSNDEDLNDLLKAEDAPAPKHSSLDSANLQAKDTQKSEDLKRKSLTCSDSGRKVQKACYSEYDERAIIPEFHDISADNDLYEDISLPDVSELLSSTIPSTISLATPPDTSLTEAAITLKSPSRYEKDTPINKTDTISGFEHTQGQVNDISGTAGELSESQLLNMFDILDDEL